MKTKYIFALTLVVILGLWSNKLTRFAMLSPNGPRLARLDIKAMDYEMYQRSNIDKDREEVRAQSKPYKLAGMGTFKKDELFARPKQKVAPIPVDTKAKKKEDDKKKKKKKKTADLARIRQDYINKTIVYQEAQRRKAAEAAAVTSTFASGPVAQPPKADNKDAEDIAKWIALLLGRPDKEQMTLFIREYQNNKISEVVFYTILDKLYAERNSEFKSLAVLGAGSVSSLRSFDFLVKALSDDNAGADIGAQANAELQEYAALTSVAVLRQVLITHIADSTKIQIAVTALAASTNHYLTKATSDTDQTRTPAANIRSDIFATFVEPLEAVIAAYASNSAISEPANRALTQIKAVTNTLAQNNNE